MHSCITLEVLSIDMNSNLDRTRTEETQHVEATTIKAGVITMRLVVVNVIDRHGNDDNNDCALVTRRILCMDHGSWIIMDQ